ncbi:hypothetical protein, partial [Pseudomonas sp. MWU12-2115]|uniref:hypothetical protein n=1 Tax=Pseudomonas sp. MWU12-2115 TaxID=2071713 RepID=UPI00131470A6
VGMERDCVHYLMSNAKGRRDGAMKAHNHDLLCRHIIAAIRGCDPDLVRRHHEDHYQAVHDGNQALTSYLDEVIGFPMDERPDYADLTPKFFDKFFELAMRALGISAQQASEQNGEAVAYEVATNNPSHGQHKTITRHKTAAAEQAAHWISRGGDVTIRPLVYGDAPQPS